MTAAQLDTAAVDAVRQWKYKPMTCGETPIEISEQCGGRFFPDDVKYRVSVMRRGDLSRGRRRSRRASPIYITAAGGGLGLHQVLASGDYQGGDGGAGGGETGAGEEDEAKAGEEAFGYGSADCLSCVVI